MQGRIAVLSLGLCVLLGLVSIIAAACGAAYAQTTHLGIHPPTAHHIYSLAISTGVFGFFAGALALIAHFASWDITRWFVTTYAWPSATFFSFLSGIFAWVTAGALGTISTFDKMDIGTSGKATITFSVLTGITASFAAISVLYGIFTSPTGSYEYDPIQQEHQPRQDYATTV